MSEQTARLYQFLVTFLPLHQRTPILWHFDLGLNSYEGIAQVFVQGKLRMGVSHALNEPWSPASVSTYLSQIMAHPAYQCGEFRYHAETQTALADLMIRVDVPTPHTIPFRLYFLSVMPIGRRNEVYLMDSYQNRCNIKKTHWKFIRCTLMAEPLLRPKSFGTVADETLPLFGQILYSTKRSESGS